jgi:hypothetical protein
MMQNANQELAAEVESLRNAQKIEREQGNHFDKMAGFFSLEP